MVRVINPVEDQEVVSTYLGLAIRDDVNTDAQMSRFMENIEEEVEFRALTLEEQRVMEDEQFASELAELFDLDESFIQGEGHEAALELIDLIADTSVEGQKEDLESILEGTIRDPQVTYASFEQFELKEKVDLLDEEFKERSTRKFKSLIKEQNDEIEPDESMGARTYSGKSDSMFDEIRENGHTNFTSGSSIFGNSSSGTRKETVDNTTTATTTVFDREKREKQLKNMYSHGAQSMRNMAFSGREKVKKKKKRNHFGKKRFSVKNVWGSVKEWFHSDESILLSKIGVMLCLETGMAIITKQHEFEGTGQMLAFLGMMLGVFYISREIRAEGFDPRKMSMV